MSGIFGGLNPVSLASTALLGPVGGIAAQLVKQLASSIGQEIIQQIGGRLGLPQSTIDMAQGTFAGALGDHQGAVRNLDEAVQSFGDQFGASPTDVGDAQRQLRDAIDEIARDIAGGEEAREARAGGKGGSWLMALARALGEKADKLADQMQDMADRLRSDKSDPSASLEFSAKSQEFGLFMNAATNAVKTAGESLTKAASKN